MAQVYKGVHGKELEDWLAHEKNVHSVVEIKTAMIGLRAKQLKARHVDQEHSYVETEIAPVDGWVILNDTRGKKAAMAMEYGSAPHKGFPDGTPAQAILHDAASIPLKSTWPRSRRVKKFVRPRRRKRK